MFRHQLVESIHLPRREIDGKRHYVLPDGTALKSVTTILGEKLDKSGLDEWRKRVGDAEADRIGREANERGIIVHGIAERYLMNDPRYMSGVMPIHASLFRPIRKVLDEKVDDIMGVEIRLYSRALQAAGTCDLVCSYDGVTTVVDFKTSRRLKDESWIEGYFLQATIYSMMFEALYKVQVPQIAVIIASDFADQGEAQVFVRQRSDYVRRVLEVFS